MTLRRRLTAAFVLCALLAATCFAALGVVFVYTVEDSFLDRMLEQESQGIATPLRPHLHFYKELEQFPRDLAPQLTGEIRQGEFFGSEGRHYHVRKVGARYMVAEVSSQLVVRHQLPELLGILSAMACLLLLTIGGAGYLFARRTTAPLEKLAGLLEASDGAALPGGFAKPFGPDEVGAVARALDAAMERIAEFLAREQAFTRDASHELRTPIGVIDGAAALMEAENLSAEGRAQLRRIREACALMQRTTHALLTLSREEQSAGAATETRLLPLIESAVVNNAPLLEGKTVDCLVDVSPRASMVANAGVLEIVLANVIGNAFSHTVSGEVHVFMDGQALVIRNTAEPEGGSTSGYGFGLSIARRLAAAHRIPLSADVADGYWIVRLGG